MVINESSVIHSNARNYRSETQTFLCINDVILVFEEGYFKIHVTNCCADVTVLSTSLHYCTTDLKIINSQLVDAVKRTFHLSAALESSTTNSHALLALKQLGNLVKQENQG